MTTARRVADAVPQSDVRKVPVRDIRLDSAYQRDLDNARVQKMVREWDQRRNDPILCSARAGSLWCIDGQHRLAALRELGELYVQAIVLEGLTQLEEADLFVLRQRGRRNLNAWDLFKAETVAGHDDVLAVIRITNARGFKISRVGGHGHIQAVGALRRIYNLGTEPLLTLTLDTIRQAWTGDQTALGGQVVEGLALFFHSFRGEPQYDQGRAFEILTKTPASRFLRDARNIAERRRTASSSSAYIAEAIRDLYNTRLSPEKKLGSIRRIKRSPRRP